VNADEMVSPTSAVSGSLHNDDHFSAELTREASYDMSDGGGDEKTSKKPVKSNDIGFTEEERDQMENLLEEVRGHLGASRSSSSNIVERSMRLKLMMCG
jgi:hypothetical protein